MTRVLIIGVPLYLMVGAVVGRLWNEHSWRANGVGTYTDGDERTANDASAVHLGRGVALTLSWPLVGVVFLLIGIGIGLTAIFQNIFVPTELRKKARS